jgi:hypothetical protein
MELVRQITINATLEEDEAGELVGTLGKQAKVAPLTPKVKAFYDQLSDLLFGEEG